MEDQCSHLALPYFFQDEGVEELKHNLMYTTFELENTIVCAHDEIAKKDQEILQLKDLLARIVKERDEALEKCQRVELEKHLLLQQQQQQFHNNQKQSIKQSIVVVEATTPSSVTTTTSNEDQPTLSSSISDENNDVVVNVSPKIVPKMPFPENGKFLQAVMEAGPLLQTLLLAGPLPEWQHPPPQLNSGDIPPVTISAVSGGGGGYFSRKRAIGGCNDSSPSKYLKVVNQIPKLTPYIISAR